MKYSNYIELSKSYESVVDLGTEERNPNLWRDYIVHDDMKDVVGAVCQTMHWEDMDKRRSFWIHGTYGTGKTHAAIVLKHLLEDPVSNIEPFLGHSLFNEYKKRFIKIREKGEFLVVWKSGVTGVRSGTHLMMEMEVGIKEKLKEKFKDMAYYGTRSLTGAAMDAVDDQSINWGHLFTDIRYGLSDRYDSFADFREAVRGGDSDAIHSVERICGDNNRTMFTGAVGRFQEWVKDVIAGNRLSETGIVLIWDEFTNFLRDRGDDDVLRELSEFCKSMSIDKDGKKKPTPFFLCLIVHRDPTWVKDLGDETYKRILHRYHNLEFHVTESAAYELIGKTIIPLPRKRGEWEEVKKGLMKSIETHKMEFDSLSSQSTNISERLANLCPIHPMTLVMLATLAENFGASERTLFRFMKDPAESSEGVGFIHYIQNNEPDKWQWLTADFLWDYFFTRRSDMHEFSADARKVVHHFQKNADSIYDEYGVHVFKAALLLIAVMSGGNVSSLYSRQGRSGGKIGATRSTLYKCFRGQLDEREINDWLKRLKDIGLLGLGEQPDGDARLELPYTGSPDLFDVRLDMTKKEHTRHKLFAAKGVFSKALEEAMWDSNRATAKRICIAACSSEKNSMDARLGEVKKELKEHPYKIGLLVVAITEAGDYAKQQVKIKETALADDSGRLVVAMLKEPCAADSLDLWHRAITHKELSAEEGKRGAADKYEADASAIVAAWAATAAEGQIYACYADAQFTGLCGKSDLIKRIEKDVLYTLFPAAPERLVATSTAYKKCTDKAIEAGLTKKAVNAQVANIVNEMKALGAWEIDDLEGLKNLGGDNAKPISMLASCFQEKFAQGARIPLDDLWAKLQQPPFGYYNSMAAGCLIGLAMRCLINGRFVWIDEKKNTHPPTEGNLAVAVARMLDGKAIGHSLSSGSDIWQKFKVYIQDLFGLAAEEAANDAEARKFIKQAITQKIGVPVWALKHVPCEKFGGEDFRSAAEVITDLLCGFIYETAENQEAVMDAVLDQFNGRGKLREAMASVLADKAAMLAAFKRFMSYKVSDFEDLVRALSLTHKDIFDLLHSYMQNSIHEWQEEQVSNKLLELAQELKVVATIKAEIGENIKTYHAAQGVLKNVFEHMKVPGTVLEKYLMESWIPALKLLHKISKTSWADLDKKDEVVASLNGTAKTAWEYLSQPKLLLKSVFNARKITLTEDELEYVLVSLKSEAYESKITAFNEQLNSLLDYVKYARDSKEAEKLWQDATGTTSINEWCNKNNTPIQWLLDEAGIAAIRTIKALQDGQTVESDALSKALIFLKGGGLSVLDDSAHVADRFFAHVGEDYRPALDKHENLIGRLKTNPRLTHEVYTWENKIPEIRETLDAYLQETYIEKAKKRVESEMPEKELRATAILLLQKKPELYHYFLK